MLKKTCTTCSLGDGGGNHQKTGNVSKILTKGKSVWRNKICIKIFKDIHRWL